MKYQFEPIKNETFEGVPIKYGAYPCDYDTPTSGVLDGYKNVDNSTCSFCMSRCEPPDITGVVEFFDGINSSLVLCSLVVSAVFTLFWQCYQHSVSVTLPKDYKDRADSS